MHRVQLHCLPTSPLQKTTLVKQDTYAESCYTVKVVIEVGKKPLQRSLNFTKIMREVCLPSQIEQFQP